MDVFPSQFIEPDSKNRLHEARWYRQVMPKFASQVGIFFHFSNESIHNKVKEHKRHVGTIHVLKVSRSLERSVWKSKAAWCSLENLVANYGLNYSQRSSQRRIRSKHTYVQYTSKENLEYSYGLNAWGNDHLCTKKVAVNLFKDKTQLLLGGLFELKVIFLIYFSIQVHWGQKCLRKECTASHFFWWPSNDPWL